MDRLLTAKDIQYRIGCGKNTAYKLIHSAGFPSLKIGGRFYVRRSDFDNWICLYTGREYRI